MTTLFLILLILIAIQPSSRAASDRPQTDTSQIDGSSASQTQEPARKQTDSGVEKTISDNWYTVTIGGTAHYGYFNEKLELVKGRLKIQQTYWKQEEGFINEEQLGAFAENNDKLTPLFYNFHSTYRSQETMIDGNITDGKSMTVKIKKAGQELPIVRRSVSNQTILSLFFPVWLGRALKKLKPGQSQSFYAILEDNLERNFSPVSGRIRLEKPDAFAEKTKTRKVSVDFDKKSIWWVDSSGEYVRIEMPSQKITIERTSKETASKFLNTK